MATVATVDEVGRSLDASVGADRASDVPDFEAFVAARSGALWRSAWLLTGDAQRAEDLLQTALVKVWRRWSSISHEGAVEAYARRALVTTYTDWWRRRWTGEVPTEVLPERGETVADTDLLGLRHDLLAALATLSRGQRAVVVLRYFEDMSEAETARVLGCSQGTVKSQLSRALAALRRSELLTDGEASR